jgi:uncharacterized repeat protein (TIGR04076 family)
MHLFLPQAIRKLRRKAVAWVTHSLDSEAGPVKITVLKRFDTKEVFKDSPVKAKYSGPCPVFKEGQVFHTDVNKPSGFCPYAWDAIFAMINTLRFGGNCSEWYEEPGVAVVCCPDGLRPVIFKLERKQQGR